jgi:kynurenine formamidase
VTAVHPGHSPSGIPEWIVQLRADAPAHPRGSLRLIDAAAIARGLDAVRIRRAACIGRPLDQDGLAASVSVRSRVSRNGVVTSVHDRLEIECHGVGITHLDALNHFGLAGTFYASVDDEPAGGVSVAELAAQPIVTRAVFLDLTERRGGHVQPGDPVHSGHLRDAVQDSGAVIEPGDALILYMGRDLYESGGAVFRPVADSPDGRPGVSADGARWLAEQPISLLAWDFLDAHPSAELPLPVHALSWASGLVLIDNCELSAIPAVMREREQRTALFVVCPLPIAGTTGCAVNPVVIL